MDPEVKSMEHTATMNAAAIYQI